jgi:hypothetical protein
MRVTRFFGERDLGELVDRLFSLKDADASRRAARRIVDANKHLPLDTRKNLADVVDPGAMIAVPAVPDAAPRGPAQPLAGAAGQAGLDRLREARPLVAARMSAANERAAAVVRDTQDRLDNPALRDAAGDDEQLRELVQKFEEDAARRLERLRALHVLQDDVLDHVEDTVAALMGLAVRSRA